MTDEPKEPKVPKTKKKKRVTGREPTVRVKTARGRKPSSTQWLQRHLNDPYVAQAQRDGYRSRAAYKLLEIDKQMRILKAGAVVVDLGAAPGGWSQVAVARKASKVVGIDLLPVDPLPGVNFLQMDFMDDEAPEELIALLGEGADVVLSDMAPNTVGHQKTDHLRIMGLVEAAAYFACDILKPGGSFVTKVFQGGAQDALLEMLKKSFKTVKHVKPPSSRSESSELFLVAKGFKGVRPETSDEPYYDPEEEDQ